MWFNFEENNDLWFNQTGQFLVGQNVSTPNQNVGTPDADFEDEQPQPLWEYGGQTPKSDIIDQFDPESGISLSHPFDKYGLPEGFEINHNQRHCDFINNEISNNYSQMNFATSQKEIDDLYEKIDLLQDLSSEEECI